MTTRRRKIPPERKLMYYGGMLLIGIGILTFVSTFFSGPDLPGFDGPRPGDPGFWERSQARHKEFGRDMKSNAATAFVGMGIMMLGGILMKIGARGTAGSGLVLDPQQARQDLEPWTRMGGGMVQDALSETDIARHVVKGNGPQQPQVKVRCQKCQELNDEQSKFCNQCGAAI